MTTAQRATAPSATPSVTPSSDTCIDLAIAIDATVDHVLAVAGAPITHVAELVRTLGPDRFEWAINEKAAAETAVGLSAAGRRSCLIVKHNGLDLALDPLMNAAVHTLGASLVTISGDDPDAASSTCVQDSRLVAQLAGVPVFEPALDGDTALLVGAAADLSERAGIPTLLKVTTRMHRSCSTGAPGPVPTRRRSSGSRAAPTLSPDIAHGLTKLGRHQRHRLVARPLVRASFEQPGIVSTRCTTQCGTAVLAVGAAAMAVPSGYGCWMVLRAGVPAPEVVLDFVDRHERTVVVEEPAPVLEEWLRARVARRDMLLGRVSGHIKPEGTITTDEVDHVVSTCRTGSWVNVERKSGEAPVSGRWGTLFGAVSSLRRAGAFVATDVGSSVRLCYPPYNGADVALCLGSAVAVAGGAARTGRRAVAVTGDYALMHSGLEGLLAATEHRLPLLVVVLANGNQAKTGGQPLPVVDIANLIRACGVDTVDRWHLDALDLRATECRLSDLISGCLPAVALVSATA